MLPSSWGTLVRVPCSWIPVESTARGSPDSSVLRLSSSMLPSTAQTVSASTIWAISGLNDTAHTLAVYASWPRSPVYFFTTTQDSLPVGDPALPGGATCPCTGFHHEVSALAQLCHRFLLIQASLAQLGNAQGKRAPPFHEPRSETRAATMHVLPVSPRSGLTNFVSLAVPRALPWAGLLPPRSGLWPAGSQLKMRHRKIRASKIGPMLSHCVRGSG